MHTTSTSSESALEEEPTSGTNRPNSAVSGLAAAFCSPWMSVALIVLLCAVNYGRTLGSFFLADDIGEVRYVHQIFSGNWNMFWSNFCGNYMQVPNMSVYRPMLLITLMFDYLFWKGNPLGYYLSNLVYFTASASLLCIFVRQLCAGWGRARATIAGLASALLFATYPLHCESISWVVGRVDSACCTFYLAALCIFMTRRTLQDRRLCALGVFLFALAMCVKEMAIGLAPVVAAIGFIFPTNAGSGVDAKSGADADEAKISWKERFISAWRLSMPIWISTLIYFGIRLWALGTIFGGYNGSVGATQTSSAVARWLDADNWHRLFMPFSFDLFAPGNGQEQALFGIYCLLGFLVLVRLLANSLPWRYLAFLACWALTLVAPIYRLWGLGGNLQGARFCYFLSLALATLLPVLILAPDKKLPRAFSIKLTTVGIVAMACVAFILGRCAYATNLLWLHAGREVKAVCDDAIKLSKSATNNDRIILLGVPKQHSGAHMILNGPTLQMLMAPPFAKGEYGGPLVTLDSILFGDENLVNGARLCSLVNTKGYRGPYVWSNASKHFVEIPLDASRTADQAEPLVLPLASATPQQVEPYVVGHGVFTQQANGALKVVLPYPVDGLRLSNLNVNPLDYSYLKVSFHCSNNKIPLLFRAGWQADLAHGKSLPEMALQNEAQERLAPDLNAGPAVTREVYIPLGRNWHWYAQSRINEMSLFLPALKEITLTEIALLPAAYACPVISVEGNCNSFGVTEYTPSTPVKVSAAIGSKVRLQLSKREFFFDNLDPNDVKGGLSDCQPELTLSRAKDGESFAADVKPLSASNTNLASKKTASEYSFQSKDFGGSGYYQIRARALDSAGKEIGDYSDTLTLLVK